MTSQIVRELIVGKVGQALELARREGALNLDTLPPVAVERPANEEHGDFATSLPLRLARACRIDPMKIAEDMAGYITPGEEIERVWATAPGFVNFRLRNSWLLEQVDRIRSEGQNYGQLRPSKSKEDDRGVRERQPYGTRARGPHQGSGAGKHPRQGA